MSLSGFAARVRHTQHIYRYTSLPACLIAKRDKIYAFTVIIQYYVEVDEKEMIFKVNNGHTNNKTK